MGLRIIKVADGFSSSSVPSDFVAQSGSIVTYASQNDYVTAKGSPAANGDQFYNSTTSQIEIFSNGSWMPQVEELKKEQLNLSNGDILNFTPGKSNQSFLVSGQASAVTLSSTPFGTNPPKDRSIFRITGADDTKTVTLNFSDVDYGVYMNMPLRTLGKGQHISLQYFESLKRYVDIGANF